MQDITISPLDNNIGCLFHAWVESQYFPNTLYVKLWGKAAPCNLAPARRSNGHANDPSMASVPSGSNAGPLIIGVPSAYVRISPSEAFLSCRALPKSGLITVWLISIGDVNTQSPSIHSRSPCQPGESSLLQSWHSIFVTGPLKSIISGDGDTLTNSNDPLSITQGEPSRNVPCDIVASDLNDQLIVFVP